MNTQDKRIAYMKQFCRACGHKHEKCRCNPEQWEKDVLRLLEELKALDTRSCECYGMLGHSPGCYGYAAERLLKIHKKLKEQKDGANTSTNQG